MLSATLPEQFAGPLLLLFEQHLQLSSVMKPRSTRDLADAPHCHEFQ